MSAFAVTVRSLHIHPVKSCAGISVDEALLVETGLEFDRTWMVVDTDGQFLTQRELPRLQLVKPALRTKDLLLRAPGMLPLYLQLNTVESHCRVRIWNDEVSAFDMGHLAAQWFSDLFGQTVRLARFDPQQRRLSSRKWTGGIEAENAFSDGYPILVTSVASLDELNRRLALQRHAPVAMERFRPNIVLDGLDSHGEDFIDEVVLDAPEGPVRLKLVKPCSRCSMPNVDPITAEQGTEPGDALAGYRADPRLEGAITFGMNAVIVDGLERSLRVGASGEASIRF